MGTLIRLVVIGFVVLTVIYICLSLYSRAVRRGKLIQAWEDAGEPGERDDYVRQGLEEYSGSLRRKLLLGVYVVPVVVVATIIYLTNYH